ncbi:hypothetical protein GCM10010293_41270 [Streptomyces griseoflavus]|uniref:DUF7167 family protein n=1 Tax=Streptomyces griseoflavus TaxID=35619 RepID=UPI00167D330A|nr:hypothetical protein [Streptomyces griseoflavus]GGV37444.1 hypothetical protein GCM10010293_41270 [Streptomyces griseoflavus]
MAKVLKVGVEMGGSKDEADIALPDDWDGMSPEEQRQWADEVLDVHVSNNVNAWWNVEDE